MTDKELGKLTPVALREVWSDEARDFTPWLAQEENLAILSDTLMIDLQLEAQEKSVGPFRADILCRDSNSDAWVLIENQLEKTNHTHLGQLLTYASGLKTVTIVWIAKAFTEEHRSALDWLNEITDSRFRFFGIEVELWKIGNSQVAPRFHIISKPNDWSRLASGAARSIGEAEHSEANKRHLAYWEAFCSMLREQPAGAISGSRAPSKQNWIAWAVGKSRFMLLARRVARKRKISVELYISGKNAKAYFYLLQQQKEDIERELGHSLEWWEYPQGQDCSIGINLHDVDPEDESDWPQQHKWLADTLNQFHKVFSARVQALNADDYQPEPTNEPED